MAGASPRGLSKDSTSVSGGRVGSVSSHGVLPSPHEVTRLVSVGSNFSVGSNPRNAISLTPSPSVQVLRESSECSDDSDSDDVEQAINEYRQSHSPRSEGEVVVRPGCSLSIPVLLAVVLLNLLAVACMVSSFFLAPSGVSPHGVPAGDHEHALVKEHTLSNGYVHERNTVMVSPAADALELTMQRDTDRGNREQDSTKVDDTKVEMDGPEQALKVTLPSGMHRAGHDEDGIKIEENDAMTRGSSRA